MCVYMYIYIYIYIYVHLYDPEEPYHAYNRVKLSTFFEHREVDKLAYSGEEKNAACLL